MKYGIGIDIGAYSCKAFILKNENQDALNLITGMNRSVASVNGNGEIIAGNINYAESHPSESVFDIKRRIISSAYESEGEFRGRTLIEIYTEIVKHTIRLCEKSIKEQGIENGEIESVTFTVPGFSENKPEVVAALKSGFAKALENTRNVSGNPIEFNMIAEPVAAAIHNIYEYSKSGGSSKPETILVYDFGHTTLDFAVITTDGENAPGVKGFLPVDTVSGEIIDAKFADAIKRKYRNASNMQADKPFTHRQERNFLNQANKLKVELSDKNEVAVSFYDDAGNDEYSFTFTRTEFENIIGRTIDESIRYLNEFLLDIKDVKVDKIILSGGGASIPLVERKIRENFPHITVEKGYDPIYAVAKGAARYDYSQRITDVTNYSWGLKFLTNGKFGDNDVRVFIHQNTMLPVNKPYAFTGKTNAKSEYRVGLYTTKETGEYVSVNKCNNVRIINFIFSKPGVVEGHLEMTNDHCVKVIVESGEERYCLDSFASVNAEPERINIDGIGALDTISK